MHSANYISAAALARRFVLLTFTDCPDASELHGPFRTEADAMAWIDSVEAFLSSRGPSFHIMRTTQPYVLQRAALTPQNR